MEQMNEQNWSRIAEIELVYKTKVKASDRPVITSSMDAYKLLKETWNENTIELQEEFKVLLLNRANKVLGLYQVSTGSMTGTIADIKLIFATALKAAACTIMLAHNHPSGNLKPSQADCDLTSKIKQAGTYLEIKVIDHLIITPDSYFSFADEGLL